MLHDFRCLVTSSGLSAFSSSQLTIGLLVFIATDALGIGSDHAPALGGAYLAVTAAVAMAVARVSGRTVSQASDVAAFIRRAEVARTLVLATALVALILTHQAPRIVHFLVVALAVVLMTIAGQFYQPARAAIVRELLSDNALDKGASVQQTANTTGQLVGAAVGPFISTVGGLSLSIAVALLTSVVSLIALHLIRAVVTIAIEVPHTADSSAAQVQVSLPKIPAVRAVMGGAFFVTLGVGAASTLDPYFLTGQLGVSVRWLGALGVALSAGLIVGGLLYPLVSRWLGRNRALYLSLACAGTVFLLYAAGPNIYWCVAMLFLFAVAGGVAEASVGPILMTSLSRESIPLVFSYLAPVVQMGSLLSLLGFGVAASLISADWRWQMGASSFGREASLMGVSAICIVIGAIAVRRTLCRAMPPCDVSA